MAGDMGTGRGHRRLTDEALTVLERQEAALVFPAFGAEEALALGCSIARLARGYDRGVTIEIVRVRDGMLQFAWSMDDKAPRNFGFTEGKRRVTLRTGHASLWAYVDHELTGGCADLCDAEAGFCPAGGAFPIRVAGSDELVSTVAVSGLHEGKDHELVVRGLAAALGKAYGADVPVYAFAAV